jgi:hypothetical protein
MKVTYEYSDYYVIKIYTKMCFIPIENINLDYLIIWILRTKPWNSMSPLLIFTLISNSILQIFNQFLK